MDVVHNYSLAFKVEKKNPMTVEISKIDPLFEMLDTSSLEVIDTFTSKYTNDELMNVIRNSNTLTEEYLNGELLVLDNTTGWRHPAIVNEGFGNSELIEYLIINKSNKNIMNRIYNKISKHIKEEEFNQYCKNLFLGECELKLFLNAVRNLPYLMRREMKLLCFELYKKDQKVNRLEKAS